MVELSSIETADMLESCLHLSANKIEISSEHTIRASSLKSWRGKIIQIRSSNQEKIRKYLIKQIIQPGGYLIILNICSWLVRKGRRSDCSCLISSIASYLKNAGLEDSALDLSSVALSLDLSLLRGTLLPLVEDEATSYIRPLAELTVGFFSFGTVETDSELRAPDKAGALMMKSGFTPDAKQQKGNRVIGLTVYSPVSVKVYLEDKMHLVMILDRNRTHFGTARTHEGSKGMKNWSTEESLRAGFDYQSCTIVVPEEFTLIFKAKGFEKIVHMLAPEGDYIDFKLRPLLEDKEIIASFDRQDAIKILTTTPFRPTTLYEYAFQQLSYVGTEEDIALLQQTLERLSNHCRNANSTLAYPTACCAEALSNVAINCGVRVRESLEQVTSVYEQFPAKETFGQIFEKAITNLKDFV